MRPWLLLTTLALVSCSADSTGEPDCGCGPVPEAGVDTAAGEAEAHAVADFCARSLGRQAALYESCCTQEDKSTLQYKLAHGMIAAMAWECQDKLGRSVAQGRMALRDDVAESCAQAVAAAYDGAGCAILRTGFDWETTSCRGAVVGLQGEGDPCRYRYECADGLTCGDYRDGVDGYCEQVVEGSLCRMEEYSGAADDAMDALFGEHPVCAPGWSCQHTDQFGICARTVAEGSYCVSTQDCDPGLRCHLGACGTGTPSQEGGDCSVAGDCIPGLYCSPPAQPGSWGRCSSRKAAGEPCSSNPVDECRGYCGPAVCVEMCGSG